MSNKAPVSGNLFSATRMVPRFRFIADAEVTSVPTHSRIVARVSELSAQGCYLDTPDTFPEGTALLLRIRYGSSTCELKGVVIYTHAGWGMGASFADITAAQSTVLDAWLGELARKTTPRRDANRDSSQSES